MGGWDAGTTLTVVGGKILVQDGQLQHLDESKIVEQANAVAARALETAAKRTGLPLQSYAHRECAIDHRLSSR
jgi:hypothetical protein